MVLFFDEPILFQELNKTNINSLDIDVSLVFR